MQMNAKKQTKNCKEARMNCKNTRNAKTLKLQ